MTAARLSTADTTSPFGTYRAEGLGRMLWRLADEHRLVKPLRKGLRRFAARHCGGPYDAEVEGLRFRLYPGENYDCRKMIARRRLPERAEHEALAAFLKPGAVFVDVGANIGSYALFAAARGATVIAIEANPSTADRLSFNIRANADVEPCRNNIRVMRQAAGECTTKARLWSEPSNCGFATMAEELTGGEWAGDWRAVDVEVRPLADMLKDAGVSRVDVLKVDVEGLEDQVLLPFLDALAPGNRPLTVMCETNCSDIWAGDCRAALAAAGYRPILETNDNVIVTRAG